MAYSFQTFSVLEVMTATKMNQVEINVRDHVHGVDGVSAAPVYDRVVRTAGSITTTSTSLVDVTGATVTFTTKARPVSVGLAMSEYNDTLSQYNAFNIDVDGTLLLGTTGLFNAFSPQNIEAMTAFTLQSAALTAASHTIKAQWKVSGGTGTILATAATNLSFWAQEI